MAKKLARAQATKRRAAKAKRRKEHEIVFINGKQVRVKRPPMVDGIPVDEFLARNADPIWLHQNELWHLMPDEATGGERESDATASAGDDRGDIPF